MDQKQQKSNEVLAQDIAYIKSDILEIKRRLDEKYVSHETFELVIADLRKADSRIISTAMFFSAPLYTGVIALLIKMFLN